MNGRTVAGAGVQLALLEAGDPQRPTLVLVHGYPDTKELWTPVIERLAPRFHVVAYDVRGAGESSAPRGPAAYDFERLADDLDAVIADVLAPGQAAHLVGHDWGGIAGWEFASLARFDGRLASFTSIAGPSLDQLAGTVGRFVRRGRLIAAAARLRRSWYVAVLWTPGGPTVSWRLVLSGGRWRWYQRNVERLPGEPAATLLADGLHGSNLYRRNIPRRLLRPRRDRPARVPVQLIVPSGDRYISTSYYEEAERFAPRLRRRTIAGSHWAPRANPELIARWIGEFVEEVERGSDPPRSESRPWVRGGGVAQLSGRLALITGAGSGIGRATAHALAAHGVRPLIVDRDEAAAASVADSLPGAVALTCDVSDSEAMEGLARAVLAEHGVPDIVVNNAGIGVAGPFLETGFDDWRRVLDVNVMGVVHGCRLFARAMIDRGEGGHIVNTASAAAFQPAKELPAYAASKAAVLMLSECLRAEVLPYGIGVTAVCPGIIATNITRSTVYVGRSESDQDRLREYVTGIYERRRFTPEQVADEIVDAIATDRPVAVVTPEAKLMRALSRFAPGLLRRLARIEALPV